MTNAEGTTWFRTPGRGFESHPPDLATQKSGGSSVVEHGKNVSSFLVVMSFSKVTALLENVGFSRVRKISDTQQNNYKKVSQSKRGECRGNYIINAFVVGSSPTSPTQVKHLGL